MICVGCDAIVAENCGGFCLGCRIWRSAVPEIVPVCPMCEKPFEPKSPRQVYCCSSCGRHAAYRKREERIAAMREQVYGPSEKNFRRLKRSNRAS
jgi:hypothetical protein